jgi:hypothetical protein
MRRLKVQDAEYEEQAGGEGVFEGRCLENGPYDNENTYNCCYEAGAFGFTFAQEQHADWNPHHADQKK